MYEGLLLQALVCVSVCVYGATGGSGAASSIAQHLVRCQLVRLGMGDARRADQLRHSVHAHVKGLGVGQPLHANQTPARHAHVRREAASFDLGLLRQARELCRIRT